MVEFQKALETLINRHSMENASNTPDFLLAEFLVNCLRAFNLASEQKEKWFAKEAVEDKTVTELARQRAAQAWCQPKTKGLDMIPELAEAFAEILDDIWGQPWLGNATTREMLDEIAARVDLDYKTVSARL